jgi:gliding motility-associated-like protein
MHSSTYLLFKHYRRLLSCCFVFILVVHTGLHAQVKGNLLSISSVAPQALTVCGATQTFTIDLYNPTPFTLKNDTLLLSMPTGMNYVAGSVTGATELNITAANAPTFSLTNIDTLTHVLVTFMAYSDCGILPFIAAGKTASDYVRVDYTKNGSAFYDDNTSASYTIKQANLSITTVSNQSYSGVVGNTFTRCITITNQGLGELSQFNLTDIHGSGLSVTSVNNGSWTHNDTTETITCNNFTAIGNNNNLFESGESITICETIKILSCVSVQSDYTAAWGCNNKQCQFSASSGNVIFPGLTPDLVITPNNGNTANTANLNSCMGPGNASPQQLKIVNTGLGNAINVVLDIFQSTGTGYVKTLSSYIDQNSFTIQVGSHGTAVSITPDSSFNTNTLSCMPAGSKGRVLITLPLIKAGDTLYVNWNSYSCCFNECTGIGSYYTSGWRYKGTYNNTCENNFVIGETWGRVYSGIRGDLSNNNSPATLSNGQTGTFDFLFTDYSNNYPAGPGVHWKIEFTLPACLTYSGNLFILEYNGTGKWNPDTVTVTGNVVTAIFNGKAPWSLLQAEIKIDLGLNCSGCGTDSGLVAIKAFYVPNSSCGCEVGVSCQSSSVNMNCPLPCAEGMDFTGFTFMRTSYGLPDNEAGGGNGLPDAAGSLDFTKIRTDRAMYGDTITATYTGIIKTSAAHPSWTYAYASASITNGINLSFIDAKLLIYRGGALLATCTGFTPATTSSLTTRTYTYDLSVSTLAASLPAGFVYLNADSVVFIPRYRVSTNIGNTNISNAYSTNAYYVSDIAKPTAAADIYQCNNLNGNCSLIGYYFLNYGPNNYLVTSCNTVIITQDYYLSIGPCCTNYAGGNLFPYEYRNWAHIDTLTVTPPAGYAYVSASLTEYRTAGTTVVANSGAKAVNPVLATAASLVFPVESLYSGYGGTVPLSDDGFYGTLQVTLIPSCAVLQDTAAAIDYTWRFANGPYLQGSPTSTKLIANTDDYINYDGPSIFMQSVLPSVTSKNDTAGWNISLSNTSNSSTGNSWITASTPAGVHILRVYDVDNGGLLASTNGIYEIGTINAASVRNFILVIQDSSCTPDSIVVYTGWNCQGYPTSINNYPCSPQKLVLKVTPLMPDLFSIVKSPAAAIALCDTASYAVTIKDIQIGSAYNILLNATLPPGLQIIPGSSMLSYPDSLHFVSISNPALISGTQWQWNISASNNNIGLNGLQGILDSGFNKITLAFKVMAACGYASGSTIAFSSQGKAFCGQPTGNEVINSAPLIIAGAGIPYLTDIILKSTYITPCAASTQMQVTIHNKGPQAFLAGDSVTLVLPKGVSYVTGSMTGIHQAPPNAIPNQYTLNNNTYVTWGLATGVTAGDSTVFTFNFSGDPAQLSCSTSLFQCTSTSATHLQCLAGTPCNIKTITGDTSLDIFTYKSYFAFSNGSATSASNPPSGETVTVHFNIHNSGEETTLPTVISYYTDANGNGTFDPADIYISKDTITAFIDSSVYHYTGVINFPAGKTCAIIAVLDSSLNHCFCSPVQLLLNPRLKDAGRDTAICSGNTTTLGTPAINGYAYNWSPATGLSSSAVSNPVVTGTNTTTVNQTTTYILTTNRINCTSTDTVVLTIYPVLTASASMSPVLCKGGNTGSATVTASGGTGVYTYSWTPTGGNSTTASNLTAGTYTVMVNNMNLCSITTSVSVTEPPKLNATLISNPALCNGGHTGSATVTASGGTGLYTFVWSPTGGTDSIATGLIAGTYSVMVQDANLCKDTGTVIINQPPKLMTSVSVNKVLCNGGSTGSATVTVSGGTGTYNYLWMPTGSTDSLVNNLSAGSYSVIITDANACKDTTTTTIGEPAKLNATFISKAVLCNGGNTGSATAIVNGGTKTYTYTWIPTGGTDSVANNLSAGTYSVIVSDANTCKDTAAVTINEPAKLNATVISNSVLCKGGNTGSASVTTTGGTKAYTYIWFPAGGTDSVANHLNAGTYTVFIQDANACKDTAWVTITEPVKLNATSTSHSVLCNGGSTGSATVTASGGTGVYTYAWSPTGGTDSSASSLSAGNYTVIIKDGNLCVDTTGIRITEPLPFVVTLTGSTKICINQSALLHVSATGGTPSYTYLWFPVFSPVTDTTSVTASPSVTTIYTVEVTDANNCIAPSQTVQVTVRPAINTYINGDTAICGGAGGTINAIASGGNGIYHYYWIPTGETTASITASPLQTTTYTVVVSDACSPVDSTSFTIKVNPFPAIHFKADDTMGCDGVCTNFKDLSTVQGGSIISWNWAFGDNTSNSPIQNPIHCYTKPGNYNVSLSVLSNMACSKTYTDTELIHVYTLPNAEFTLGPQPAKVSDAKICFTNQGSSVVSWLWNFGDPTDTSGSELQNPCHTYSDTGRFCVNLTVSNIHGCSTSLVNCLVISPEFAFYIPNSFTPNGDGRNDAFSGEGIYFSDYEMWIFDRWDNLIYHTTDITKKWNGTHGNAILEEGVYVYKIMVTESPGIPHQYTGTVTLVR